MFKRKEAPDGEVDPEDKLQIIPLGAGNEVGRSCVYLSFKGKKVLFDCGIHPAYSGSAALPFFDVIDPSTLDVLLITHFHLDHSASLPYFLQQTSFKGKVFMTPATKAVYKLLVTDYLKISKGAEDDMLFTEKDIEKSMDRIEEINFHQMQEVNGIRFWCYTAGHVLGAAMFMVDIAGVRILYTGDYSREEDRHLRAAELPPYSPEVCIIESTYGIQQHQPREDRERIFTSIILQTVRQGGKVLIPAFALGRAQELLLILDEVWEKHKELHGIPIYYASPLARRCMEVYQTYIGSMNDRIRARYEQSNPFEFKHISYLGNTKEFDDSGPCVVMASPGGLQSGLSRQLFDRWCQDKRNSCLIPGYVVEGTLAKEILKEPDDVTLMTGLKVPLRMSVHYISFSAHADYVQTHQFLKELAPANVVLVHGEANEMFRLKEKLAIEFSNQKFFTPKNSHAIDMYFKKEKVARAVGRIAEKDFSEGEAVNALLLKKEFNYQLVDPEDLSTYTQLTTGVVKQRQLLHYTGSFGILKLKLRQMFDGVREVETENPKIEVHNFITLTQETSNKLVLEWQADLMADMVADAVIAIVLQLGGQNEGQLALGLEEVDEEQEKIERNNIHLHKAKVLLEGMYGDVNVEENSDKICFQVDDLEVNVNVFKGSVECKDDVVRERITLALGRLRSACYPISLKSEIS